MSHARSVGPLGAMSRDQAHDLVLAAFALRLGRTDVADVAEVPIVELGIDSLDLFETLLVLEDEHGITLPVEHFDERLTLRRLLALLDG